MATLITRASGNFTSASTWGVADTTMLQNTLQAQTNTTTGNQDSLGFTTGAITVDGMVAFAHRITGTGTVSFILWNSTDSLAVKTVTINATDLPLATSAADGLTAITLAFSSVTLTAGKSYKLRVTASSAGNAAIWRSSANSTAWDVMLRTTTTAAPAANDILVMNGDWTAAATSSTYTVTNDNTATTSFGSTTPATAVWVGSKGKFLSGTSASTAYKFKFKGTMRVGADGEYNAGTSAARMPSTSSNDLAMDVAVTGDTGVVVYHNGTFKTGGATLTTYANIAADAGGIATVSGSTLTRKSGPAFNSPLLSGTIYVNGSAFTISSVTNADTLVLTTSPTASTTGVGWIPGSTTTITTDVSTGWLSGQDIVIQKCTNNRAHHEKVTLGSNASGTTVTVPSALTTPVCGTGQDAGVLMNLTRNVKMYGTSVSLCGYFQARNGSIVDRSYDETYFLGTTATPKFGIEVAHAGDGSYTETGCSNHDYATTASSGSALRIGSIAAANISCTDNNYWLAGYVQAPFSVATSYTNCTFNNLRIGSNTSSTSHGFYSVGAVNATITNIRSFGSSTGMYLSSSGSAGPTSAGQIATNIDNLWTGNGSGGVLISGISGAIGDIYCSRTAAQGCTLTTNTNLVIDSLTGGGNTSSMLSINDNVGCLIKSFTSNSNGHVQPYGMYIAGPNATMIIASAQFGNTLANANGDIVYTGLNGSVNFHDVTFGSSVELLTTNSWAFGAWYSCMDYQSVANDHRMIRYEGTWTRDTTIYNTLSPSLRMTPTRTFVKLQSPSFFVPVASGNTATFQVEVRKSAVGDGAAYTGAQPRLMLRANPIAGITSDTVVATYASGTGSWNTLSGSSPTVAQDCVLEFFIDCDGTAGWINVDDVSCSVPNPSGFKFWWNGGPYVDGIVVITPTDVGLPFIGG